MMREEADVLLFPSLHDEGNWTALEAVACGLPVVALDRGAPGLLATEVVTTVDIESTVQGLALAARNAVANPRAVEPMTIRVARQSVELLLAVGLFATAAVPLSAPPEMRARRPESEDPSRTASDGDGRRQSR